LWVNGRRPDPRPGRARRRRLSPGRSEPLIRMEVTATRTVDPGRSSPPERSSPRG
jgi:hypothetical protein